jgi:hypothetical protein
MDASEGVPACYFPSPLFCVMNCCLFRTCVLEDGFSSVLKHAADPHPTLLMCLMQAHAVATELADVRLLVFDDSNKEVRQVHWRGSTVSLVDAHVCCVDVGVWGRGEGVAAKGPLPGLHSDTIHALWCVLAALPPLAAVYASGRRGLCSTGRPVLWGVRRAVIASEATQGGHPWSLVHPPTLAHIPCFRHHVQAAPLVCYEQM